jgi:hypothetical protein
VPDSWPQLSHAPIAVAHPSRESAEKGQQQLAWLIAKGINDEAVAEHLCERIADHASTVHLYVPSSRPFPMFFQDASNPKFDDVVANNLVFASLMGEALKGRIEALKKEARLATDNALTASTAFREALKAGVEFFDEHVVPRLEKNHSRLFLIHGLEADCTFMLGWCPPQGHAAFWLALWSKIVKKSLSNAGNGSTLQSLTYRRLETRFPR